MRRPRVVLLATVVAYDGVPHAGGIYLQALYEVLSRDTDLTAISPGTATNRDAAARPGAPKRTLLLGLEPSSSLIGRAINRWSLNLDTRLRRLDPGMPYLPFFVGLARSRSARDAIRRADVIDLQWFDSIRLVRLLRRLNPRARIVGTFHDVMSQSFAREPQPTRRMRAYWRLLEWRSRRLESRACRALDEVLVFSEKDAGLLGSPDHVRVVKPPLARGGRPRHLPREADTGTVLVVSYLARDENDKAACWTVREVWPRVVSEFPDARLRFVGLGASVELMGLAGVVSSVQIAGFVDDLDREYDAAATCLVPVSQGAGVKFKTIEGLLHGVPLVTTSVGAEGVAGVERFAAVADTAEGLAAAIVATLRDQRSFQARADDSQTWARVAFGHDRFVDQMRAAWALSASEFDDD